MSTGFTLSELATKIDASLDVKQRDKLVSGIATLECATKDNISFFNSNKYLDKLQKTRAAAIIISPADAGKFTGNKLIIDNPYLGFAKVARIFAKSSKKTGISSTASIDVKAKISPEVYVGDNAVIEKNVELAPGVEIGAGAFIGTGVYIGKNSKILPNASILAGTVIGKDCILHSGCVVGDDGFGFAKDGEKWLKIPQNGKVVIHDNVEIGSNTTIDCGALDNTVIKSGVKIDNLVQIAHNVRIGENTVIAGATAIAGSTKIGKNCEIAGQVGIVGHIEICDNVFITGKTMVSKSITVPGVYSSGWPMRENSTWKKMVAGLARVGRFNRRLSELENELKKP